MESMIHGTIGATKYDAPAVLEAPRRVTQELSPPMSSKCIPTTTEETTETKRCSRCKQHLPKTSFSKDCHNVDGLRYQCKNCCAKADRRYRASHPEVSEQYRESNRHRRREYDRRRYSEKREQINEKERRWRLKNRKRTLENQKSRRLQSPEKHRAREAVRLAERRGDLVRPTVCSQCQRSDAKIEAHHPDYSKPLNIQWLCVPCHRRRHAKTPVVDEGVVSHE